VVWKSSDSRSIGSGINQEESADAVLSWLPGEEKALGDELGALGVSCKAVLLLLVAAGEVRAGGAFATGFAAAAAAAVATAAAKACVAAFALASAAAALASAAATLASAAFAAAVAAALLAEYFGSIELRRAR